MLGTGLPSSLPGRLAGRGWASPAEMSKMPIDPLVVLDGSVMLATVLELSIGIDWANM